MVVVVVGVIVRWVRRGRRCSALVSVGVVISVVVSIGFSAVASVGFRTGSSRRWILGRKKIVELVEKTVKLVLVGISVGAVKGGGLSTSAG